MSFNYQNNFSFLFLTLFLKLSGPSVPCLFILMEMANGGNLEEYIEVQWKPDTADLPPKQRALAARAAQSKAKAFEKRAEVINHARLYGGIGEGRNHRKVKYLREEEIWSLFLDICEGLYHLHRNGIIHRDLVN